MEYPLQEYLKEGVTAAQATELLRQNDCLTFRSLSSGLFPAANFDDLTTDESGMSGAWLCDSACIGLALLATGEQDTAAQTTGALAAKLEQLRPGFQAVIQAGQAPADDKQRPPVRFSGQDSEPQYQWANAQNDALGYSLQLIGAAARAGLLDMDETHQATVRMIVDYLAAVQYWHDADSGHWEEIKKVNASSIGTALAGLLAVREFLPDPAPADALIEHGRQALVDILPSESKTPGQERDSDAALIFLVEPQQVIKGEQAAKIIENAERQLMGERGFRRYNGDSYWGPDYREHFMVGARTADFSDPKNMALRDQYLTPGNEAQWTFFDPMVSTYYARRYQATDAQTDAAKAQTFMARALKSIITHQKPGGETVWRLPELFFLEKGAWVPNDHLGLLWGQANLLYGLRVYQEIFGDRPIKGGA